MAMDSAKLEEKPIPEFANYNYDKKQTDHIVRTAYLNLYDELELCQIEHKYDESLKLVYFKTSKESTTKSDMLFMPIRMEETFTLEDVDNFLRLCQDNERFHLILVSENCDQTCLYYQLSNGLHKAEKFPVPQDEDPEEARSMYRLSKIADNSN